ncbi:hypothetical protein [Aurantivibrio plasticivorans]
MKWQKLTILGAFFAALLAVVMPSLAQDNTVSLSTTITGNQEQPRVLYIVPWRSVNDSELEESTIQSQVNLVFGHIEKIELQRELSYMENLEKKTQKKSK